MNIRGLGGFAALPIALEGKVAFDKPVCFVAKATASS
jgi:hypothetical protein